MTNNIKLFTSYKIYIPKNIFLFPNKNKINKNKYFQFINLKNYKSNILHHLII